MCPLCRISHGLDPDVVVVWSAPRWCAFFPPEPATPGHTLIVPRDHSTDLWDAELQAVHDLITGVVVVGGALRRVLEPEGLNLISSAGVVAEQTVLHTHVHVVP